MSRYKVPLRRQVVTEFSEIFNHLLVRFSSYFSVKLHWIFWEVSIHRTGPTSIFRKCSASSIFCTFSYNGPSLPVLKRGHKLQGFQYCGKGFRSLILLLGVLKYSRFEAKAFNCSKARNFILKIYKIIHRFCFDFKL
jgi:hypothetical protein